jgi:hypothetical protein
MREKLTPSRKARIWIQQLLNELLCHVVQLGFWILAISGFFYLVKYVVYEVLGIE